MTEAAWYVVHTKPKQEQLALMHLQRQDYDCYLPMLKLRRRKATGYVWRTEVMFPRYLFIQLNTHTDHWAPIRSTRGVRELVRFGLEPAKIPVCLLDVIREQEAVSHGESAEGEDAIPQFHPGQKVVLIDGAFAGYEAIFEEQSGAKRAQILLEMAGRSTRLQVGVDTLADSAA